MTRGVFKHKGCCPPTPQVHAATLSVHCTLPGFSHGRWCGAPYAGAVAGVGGRQRRQCGRPTGALCVALLDDWWRLQRLRTAATSWCGRHCHSCSIATHSMCAWLSMYITSTAMYTLGTATTQYLILVGSTIEHVMKLDLNILLCLVHASYGDHCGVKAGAW